MKELELSNHQSEILKQLRTNLDDILTPHDTDSELLKWLRAKKFNLEKAEKGFRQLDLHRRMRNVENMNETMIPKVLQKYQTTCFLGFSKDGTPVRYTSFNVDFSGFMMSLSLLDLTLYFAYLLEVDSKAAREENEKIGQNHDQIIYICDMRGYFLQGLTCKYVVELTIDYLRGFQELCPEKWRYIFFINVPYFFYKVMHVLNPVLKKTFYRKLKIASESTTPELLKKYIDEDIIPVSLGGKRVHFEKPHYKKLFVNPYCKIPEEFYLKNSMHFINEADPGVNVVTIGARCCYNIPLILKEAGRKLRAEFRTENGAIYFGLLYRQFYPGSEYGELPASDEYFDPDDETSDVLFCGTKFKCFCDIAPNDGICTTLWPGIYILHFDNTRSWFGSRKLYYRVTITSPDA